VPSSPRGVSWIPRVPFGPFDVPLDPPACPPVPLIGVAWVLQQCSNGLVRPAGRCAPSPGVLLPAVRWLSSLAVAHVCVHA
jgi:hypothetical protein